MSVPKSERKQSNVEYITILQQMEIYFLELNISESGYVKGLTDELVNLSKIAYNNATMYFEMTNGIIQGTLAQKKKYCRLTFWTSRQLASQINILVTFRMKQNKSVKNLILKTNDLLKVCKMMQEQNYKLNHLKEDD